jgi:hypothetical protein
LLRHVQVPGMRSCPFAPQPFPCPPCWSTPGWRQEKEIPGVLFPLLCNTHASARRRLHESPSMAAASVSPAPREGPRAGGAPTASGRNNSVSGTIYQPSRRYIDFFSVLPRCCRSCRQHGQAARPPSQRCWHSSCLMASVPTASRRAAPRGRGRHTVSMGGCRSMVPSGGSCAGGRLHSGGNALETPWAQARAGRTRDAP